MKFNENSNSTKVPVWSFAVLVNTFRYFQNKHRYEHKLMKTYMTYSSLSKSWWDRTHKAMCEIIPSVGVTLNSVVGVVSLMWKHDTRYVRKKKYVWRTSLHVVALEDSQVATTTCQRRIGYPPSGTMFKRIDYNILKGLKENQDLDSIRWLDWWVVCIVNI